MVSAMDNGGHLYFKMFDGGFTVQVFIDFMRRLVNQSRRKVFLIVDNLSVHKSVKVVEWVKKNSARIRLFFPPNTVPTSIRTSI
jgi:transposase